MRDLFISSQPTLINSWLSAFPKAQKIAVLDDHALSTSEAIYWVHIDQGDQTPITETLALIFKHQPTAHIIVLANTPNQSEAFQALSLGARGYCHAFSDSKILKEVKTVVAHGGVWMGQELIKQLIHATTPLVNNQTQMVAQRLAKLTKREQQVAIEAAKGFTNKEIAKLLNISDRTVKAHLSASFETLGAKDRLHLALMLNDNTLK